MNPPAIAPTARADVQEPASDIPPTEAGSGASTSASPAISTVSTPSGPVTSR